MLSNPDWDPDCFVQNVVIFCVHFNRRTIIFSISLQAIWVSKGKANMMANWVLEWRRQENATSSLRYNSRVPN